MMATTLPLSPFLCFRLPISTPRGCMVLPLLPCPEYGTPSITLMLEGGEGGRPVRLLVINN